MKYFTKYTRALWVMPLTLLLFGGSSCTEKIPLELNEGGQVRLVVEGWITNETIAHEVQLTTTTSYFENQAAPRVSGAIVSLSDGTSSWTLSENGAGIYQTPVMAGEFGKTYTLDVIWNEESYSATTYLDTVSAIDSVDHEWHAPPWDEDGHYDLFLYTQELPEVGDFYMWRLSKNGVPIRDTLTEITFVEDDFVNGNYIAGWQFETVDAVPGDTILVEQLSINEEAFNIFTAIMLETDWRGGLFDSPPANVPSNVSNGALGYFGAAGRSEYTIVIEP